MNVLQPSKQDKEKERAGEKKIEWELDLLECSWMREKKKIKEGGIEIGHWAGVWRRKTRKKKWKKEMKRMDENEMKERKNNIKNKKS